MKINRMSIAAGLTVGVLAGGAGGAVAATASGSTTTNPSSTMTRATGGWDGYGHRWGGGTAWRDPATGVGWGAWANDTNSGGVRWRGGRTGRMTDDGR